MDNRLEINIAIIGTVSSGKTTLMNSLFVNQYSDMKIKRTTMTPQVYYETCEKNKQAHSKDIIGPYPFARKNLYHLIIEPIQPFY